MTDRQTELRGLTRGFVQGSHGQIHYATAGSGDALLLLHQSAQSWRIYARMANLLAPHYRVVAMDLPGFGESSPLPAPYEISDMVDVVVELLDGLGIDQVRVTGHHTGALLTCELAAAHPDRVVALAPSGYFYRNAEERARAIETFERMVGQPPVAPRFDLKADGSHLIRVFERMFIRRWQGKVSATAGTEPLPSVILPFDQAQERPEHTFGPMDIQLVNESIIDNLRAAAYGALPTNRAVTYYDPDPRLPLITAPTLIMESSGSLEVPHIQRASIVQQLIPASKIVTIENGSVFVVHSRAAECAKILIDFFGDAAP